MDEIDQLIQSAEPNRDNITVRGCCPHCGESAQYLFERPRDGYRLSHGFHRDVCHVHKVKSAHGDRVFSAWEHMTDEELEAQYRLLDSYEEVNFNWIPGWLLKLLVVPRRIPRKIVLSHEDKLALDEAAAAQQIADNNAAEAYQKLEAIKGRILAMYGEFNGDMFGMGEPVEGGFLFEIGNCPF
jgi:hypothetical protein